MSNDVRKVTVKVTTKDGKDNGAVPVFTEVNRGAGEVRTGGQDLVCNGKETEFELRPGERLVIEGFTPTAVAYDRDQAAAYRPDQQKNSGGVDSAKADKVPENDKNEQTSQTGAKPGETQDSRLKSSPGTTVTPAMSQTPSANTGAPSSTPNANNTSQQPLTKSSDGKPLPGSNEKK